MPETRTEDSTPTTQAGQSSPRGLAAVDSSSVVVNQANATKGKTTIANGVVAKIVGIPAREIDGVHDVVGSGAGALITGLGTRVTRGDMGAQGVSVEVGEREAAASINIVVVYGVSIPHVAEAVRRNVIDRVEAMTGLTVIAVDIAVNDLYLPEDEILAQEVKGFSEEYPSENFYNLDIGGLPFGFLYISPDTRTLGWQGAFNFTSLTSEALERLPSYIELDWTPTRTQDSMMVYLIRQAGELTVYDLRQEDQYNQYQDIVKKPEEIDKISFVRYDVQHTTTPSTLQYSFTAENPRWHPATGNPRNELTILLPRSQSWSSKLLEWVIEHHIEASLLRERLDPQVLSTTISSLPGS